MATQGAPLVSMTPVVIRKNSNRRLSYFAEALFGNSLYLNIDLFTKVQFKVWGIRI